MTSLFFDNCIKCHLFKCNIICFQNTLLGGVNRNSIFIYFGFFQNVSILIVENHHFICSFMQENLKSPL